MDKFESKPIIIIGKIYLLLLAAPSAVVLATYSSRTSTLASLGCQGASGTC